MTLKERINNDWKQSMRNRDELRKVNLSSLRASIHNEEIALKSELDDAAVQVILRREIKKRQDAVESYRSAGADDRAAKEGAEIVLLEEYLPTQMSELEIHKLVNTVVGETGATSIAGMGQVMKMAQERSAGRADNKTLSRLVREALAK